MTTSPWTTLLSTLPDELRGFLRRAAIPRYINADMVRAMALGDTRELDKTPFLEPAPWDDRGNTFVMSPSMREALNQDSMAEDVQVTLNTRLAKHFAEKNDLNNRLFHELYVPDQRPLALARLAREIEAALADKDISRAYDLFSIIKDHPLLHMRSERQADVEALVREMAPRIARRARWRREREATQTYYQREFEAIVWETLLAGPQWIVQIHAPGGFGKSMFVQNVISRMCVERDIPVARIDFDYVAHLDAASNQPWRLLLLIARQLNDQLPDEPFSRLLGQWGHLEIRTTQRRRHLSKVSAPSADPDATLAEAKVPGDFREVLEEWKSPVVIALDTFENLLHDDDATVANILKTFADVQVRVSGLRLVLAGRFDLATTSSGEERVPGFVEQYVGRRVESVDVRLGGDWRLKRGAQLLTVPIPPFSDHDARRYLQGSRQLADADMISVCVGKAGGNPMKLAMLADLVKTRGPTLEELRKYPDAEIAYLVERVLDRIEDPRVQWLLRWGTIPQLLTREFAQNVLWPMLLEHLGNRRQWDVLERDELKDLGRGNARYDTAELPLDFAETWTKLVAYSAEASWISPVPELPDTQRIHPEIRDPMRSSLRRAEQDVYHECCRRSLEYWRTQAAAAEGTHRQRALRAVTFHALEPFADRPAPESFFTELFKSLGDDYAAATAVAEEILDVQRRAARTDRGELPVPPSGVLAMAHGQLAYQKLHDLQNDQATIAQVRHHLGLSNLAHGVRDALDGRACLAVGDLDAAMQRFASALSRPEELDAKTKFWTAIHLGELRGDVSALEKVVAEARGTKEERAANEALARQLERAEDYDRARNAYATLGDQLGAARCQFCMGEIELASTAVASLRGNDADLLRAELELAQFTPMAVVDLLEPRAYRDKAAGVLVARAQAMLANDDIALGGLESILRAPQRVDFGDPLAAARAFLDDDRPDNALDALRAISSNSPRAVRAMQMLLMAEALGRVGNVDASREHLALVASMEGLPISILVDLELGWWKLVGVDQARCEKLIELLEQCSTPRWRLMLLSGLERVGAPPAAIPALRRLVELTEIDELPPLLVLRRVEVLRIAHESAAALRLLRGLLDAPERPQLPVIRAVYGAVDRVDRGAAVAWFQEDVVPRGSHRFRELGQRILEEARRRAQGWFPGRRGVGPYMQRIITSHAGVTVNSAASDIFVEPQRDGLHAPHGTFPLPSLAMRDESSAQYILAKGATDFLCELGAALSHTLTPETRELVLSLGDPSLSWVPWQLAMTDDFESIIEARGLRALRRVASGTESPTLTTSGHSRTFVVAKQIDRTVSRRLHATHGKAQVVSGCRWQEWRSVIPTHSSIIHIVASLEERRDGAVVLDLSPHAEDATGASHLARALSGPEPHLVILEVPWPGSDTEAARQLFLRERFSSQVLREYEDANLLCIGFAERRDSTNDDLSRVHDLLEAESLGEAARQLQTAKLTTRTFGDILASRGTSLYTRHPGLSWA